LTRFHVLARLGTVLNLPPDATPDEEIVRNFRRNYLVNTADITSWITGMSFISHVTILPIYASHLTSNIILLALIPAVREFGSFAPQLLLAPIVQKRARKYPLVIALGFFERIPYFLLPFAALWIGSDTGRVPAMLLFGLVLWMSLGAGLVATPWQELMAKIIPVTNRGRFFSFSFLLGRLIGFFGTAIGAYILATFAYPQNFIISFFIAAVILVLSFSFLIQTREPERPPRLLGQTHYLQRLGEILRKQANFRRYLFSRWLLHFGRMPFGLMAVYAVQRFSLPDSAAANFTSVLYGSGIFGLLIWGTMGDRFGHKRVMVIGSGVWLLALVVAIGSAFAGVVEGVYLSFALMGGSDPGIMLADLNLAMEFGPEDERPTYIGLARSITGPALLVAPLLGGWLAQIFGFVPMFLIALGCTAIGLSLLIWQVAEPRYAKRIEGL